VSDFATAWSTYYGPLREKCVRMLGAGAEADDVVQETFIRFWKRKPDARAVENSLGWLYCVATRLALDAVRKDRVRARVPPAIEGEAPSPEQAHAVRQQLLTIAAQLDPDTWEVLVFTHFDGMSQEEIAQLKGVSDRTVRRVLERAEAKLKGARS
jgi:RNA polymerase sigma-70 factor (ECF subfamily)